MAFRIQVRRDSAANWTAANPVLLAGELGAELDTSKWKIGDGVTAWNSLVYGYGATGKKIEFNWDGTQLGIREEGDTTYTYVDLVGAKGDKGDAGDDGRGITSIVRTSGTGAPGTTDTYTITFTDATTTTFTVYNGADGTGGGSGAVYAYSGTYLSTGWTGSSAPYSQTITVSGMLSTDKVFPDIALTGTYLTDKAIKENYSLIYRQVPGTDQATAYADAIPSVDIPMNFVVVR